MKKITASVFFLSMSLILIAQSVKKINNLKDAWDLTYSYTGEVKDGKPNGMGVAKYPSGNVLRYVGNFVNGIYSGKGTMFFDDGTFLSGEWKNGKLNGKGSNYNSSGVLYIGEFANGVKNGRGVMFYKDNSVLIGNFSNDKINGRGINIWTDGTIISDTYYMDDKRNGQGYQYEAKTKKLYEGEWKDDKWIQPATPTFNSFLKSANFTAEASDDHVLMGPTNSNRFLIDSSYYYDLKKGKRFFGVFNNGQLRNGIVVSDSTRFMGPINEEGASGYCYDYKAKKHFTEGNYTNDLLNGQIVDLDLTKKAAYYGMATNGEFTGKTYFFNSTGNMYVGNYVKGRINGNGYKLETTGRHTVGLWENGVLKTLTSVTTAKGETISGNQKTFAEGINSVIKTYPGSFDDIYGDVVLDENDLASIEEIDPDAGLDFTYSLIKIPGSFGKNLIAEDFDENAFYLAKFLETDDIAKARAKYNELAAQLQTVTISNAFVTGKQKLTGKLVTHDVTADKTESVFSLSGGSGTSYTDFKVWLRIRKSGSKHIVEILAGIKSGEF